MMSHCDFYAFAANFHEALVSVDSTHLIRFVNRGAERMFGYSSHDVQGKPLSLLLGAEFPFRKDSTNERVYARRKNGDLFPAEASISRFETDNDIVLAVILRDISERERKERALIEANQSLSTLVEAAPLAIYTYDVDGCVTSWNPAAERIFGYTDSEVLGRPLPIIPADRRDEFFEVLARTQKGDFLVQFETKRRRKNGRLLDVNLSTAGLFDGDGDLIGTMAITSDITDRVEMEKSLERLNKNLEKEVAERTQELVESNEELEKFAYVASHDLQEPLRIVTRYIQLLSRRYHARLDDDARLFIDYAVSAVNRMQALIEDLLEYSRLGRQGERLEPIDLGAALNQARLNLESQITENNARINCHGRLPRVRADFSRMVQLFQNILSNAIKFRHVDVSPIVEISATCQNEMWTIAVSDNGIGIEPQYFERIFIIFQRLHSIDEYPGTGMGLAICKKIVEFHGGRIWVESQPGHGSTIFFTIPEGGYEVT